MKAWQFYGTNKPLKLDEIPDPKPGPGEVVLAVKAAGICHSDVGALEDEGWMPLFPKLPVAMGHEVAGEIIELGEGVTDWKLGDRVGICPAASDTTAGYSRDGGFAYQHRAPVTDLVRMPEGLSYELAAAGTDAGMTSYYAMMTIGGVKAGDKVAVIGFGGVGRIGARVGVVAGAQVRVVEINEDVWPEAEKAGVDKIVTSVDDLEADTYDVGVGWLRQSGARVADASCARVTVVEINEDVWPEAEKAGVDKIVKRVDDLEADTYAVVVDCAGFGEATAKSINAIRRDGTIVVVGMGKLEATINTRDVILKQARILGSNGGTVEDVAACYELFASGDVVPAMTTITFDEIPDGIEKLKRSEVTGRLVALLE